jgi:hypothetical protein
LVAGIRPHIVLSILLSLLLFPLLLSPLLFSPLLFFPLLLFPLLLLLLLLTVFLVVLGKSLGEGQRPSCLTSTQDKPGKARGLCRAQRSEDAGRVPRLPMRLFSEHRTALCAMVRFCAGVDRRQSADEDIRRSEGLKRAAILGVIWGADAGKDAQRIFRLDDELKEATGAAPRHSPSVQSALGKNM